MSWEFKCLIKVVVDFNPDRFMSEYNFSMLSRGISKKKALNAHTPFRVLVLVPRGKVEKLPQFDVRVITLET